MPHTPEEKRIFLLGFMCALAHSKPLINANAAQLAIELADAWEFDFSNPAQCHEFEQDFIDAGLTMADTQNIREEDIN